MQLCDEDEFNIIASLDIKYSFVFAFREWHLVETAFASLSLGTDYSIFMEQVELLVNSIAKNFTSLNVRVCNKLDLAPGYYTAAIFETNVFCTMPHSHTFTGNS